MTSPRPAFGLQLVAIGLISGAAIAYEILLTRIFALVHWQHMVATAIGLALLGYGASGTFTTLAGRLLESHFTPAFVTNALLFAVSSVICTVAAQHLQVDPQAIVSQYDAILPLAAGFLLLAVPFFAAANCIAMTLARQRRQIPVIYGVDLLGAGLGALLLTAALAALHPAQALSGIAAIGIGVALIESVRTGWRTPWVSTVAGLGLAALWISGPIDVSPAPYKELARAQSVTGANTILQRSGVGGTVTVVDNDKVPLRAAPGLSLTSWPTLPHQIAVFVDGDSAGAIDQIESDPGASDYLGELLSALPYRLIDDPEVAQLKAGLGLGVAQALALGARTVTAVEANPLLVDLVCEDFVRADPRRCADDRVTWHIGTPRAFAIVGAGRFDLVYLHTHSDEAGLDALDIDFDLTEEAFRAYLAQLRPGGLLVVEGPTRLPPRQSIRMLATARAALLQDGIEAPADHLALLRGWQRFLLLVHRDPPTPQHRARIRELAEEGGFDLAWLPDLRPDEVNRYQQLARPFFYHAARAVLEPDGAAITTPEGRLTARPATDDRPFPHRYSPWSSVVSRPPSARHADSVHADAALLIGAMVLVLVALASLLLILLPLIRIRRRTGSGPHAATPSRRFAVVGYFGLVGLAFLAIEIAWIQVLELFLDEPLYAAAIVLAGFLVFAGLGSVWAQSHRLEHSRRVLFGAVAVIVIAGGIYLLWLADLLAGLTALSFPLKVIIALVLLAPLAFAMGIPFPVGLRYFGEIAPPFVPWAWGINGCASVISAIGSPLLALAFGFSGLMAGALASYALVVFLLPNDLIRTS